MLTHPVAERLRGLGMAAMADAFLEMQTRLTYGLLVFETGFSLVSDIVFLRLGG